MSRPRSSKWLHSQAGRFVRLPVGRRVVPYLYRRTQRRFCPCCGDYFRAFLPFGRLQRPDAMCPGCGSLERHRMLALALADRSDVTGRVLHFAPEPALGRVLSGRASEYVTTDIEGEVDVSADIIDLPFEDDRWDVIVCSHVLEHVPDDDRAIRELRRVLAPRGTAVVMVPRITGRPTDEDPTVTSSAERTKRFGQPDHVRIYGDDLEERLRKGGFSTIEAVLPDDFSGWENTARLRPLVGTGDVTLFCT